MAFTTGTATSYTDLLDKVRVFALANGWTANNWVAGTTLQLQGPGTGANRNVFVNIYTYSDAPNGIYSWRVKAATAYISGAAEGLNSGELPDTVYLNLWNNSIEYWLSVNDRRIALVARVSTSYVSMYAGAFLPFCFPSQYPNPLVVMGDFGRPAIWSHLSSARRMCVDPGLLSSPTACSAYVRTPEGTWQKIYNQMDSNLSQKGPTAGGGVKIWPYAADSLYKYYPGYDSWAPGNSGTPHCFANFVTTRQGERFVMPCMIIPDNMSPYGVLDGMYATHGHNLSSEQQITSGARTFTAFQNITRTTPSDFFLFENS